MANQVQNFDEIPQGAVIAASVTDRGSQHVELHGLELVCYPVVDGVKGEPTKRTPVTDAMRQAVVDQYNKRQSQNVSIGN